MAWRVLGRWCRPTVDTFFAVLLFGVGGTLVTVLWTFEPPREADQQSEVEEFQRRMVEQFLHERDQLRVEVERLNNASNNDIELWDDGAQHQRRLAETRKRPATFDSSSIREQSPLYRIELADGNTRVSTARTVPLRQVRVGLGDDRLNSSGSVSRRQKVRLKPVDDVTRKPEVDRLAEPSDASRLPIHVGSQRWCSVYNTTPEVDESFDCIRLLIKPSTTVCLHPDDDDVHVSRHLRQDGLWEPHIVRLFQNLLFQNPHLGVIDIGAHIGQYSLLAATMGRRVVAVEPHVASLRRLHKAVKINNVERLVRSSHLLVVMVPLVTVSQSRLIWTVIGHVT